MKFKRKQSIETMLWPKRALVLYGPRRVGKTTLVKQYLANLPKNVQSRYDIGDDLNLQELLSGQRRAKILTYAEQYDVIVIDEAQQIPKIGMAAKMIVDAFPEKKLILTGSSSFDLAQKIGEPLTGRQFEVKLMPIALNEIDGNNFDKENNLESLLLYGFYPEILAQNNEIKKQQLLQELVSSYLFKDILALDRLKSPSLLLKITKALALQIGNEVSATKLAKDVGETDHKKIIRYLDLLEKSFIIKRVPAFAKNPRNEIRKNVKYFFYDIGLRNALIDRFQKLDNRDSREIGALWENFVCMELYKKAVTKNSYFNGLYFWRNKKGQEVDLVFELGDEIEAYECKWSTQPAPFKDFKEAYPQAKTAVISRQNFTDYIN
ncbi:MAG: ATP-binding protein [Patescibacteria group bacterium]|nr:MAG: ATP-binding protein [Patescibacteria group bacterium]